MNHRFIKTLFLLACAVAAGAEAQSSMKSGDKVFTKPGVCRIAASTNLEADDGTTRHVCQVTYKTT